MQDKYLPMGVDELADILSLTIKQDKENKVATFLCQLSAFTEDSQFNVILNAPSSSGKTYIPLEISYLFPKEDLIVIGNISASAFFHEQGVLNKETNTITIDYARKILVLLDMPHTGVLEKIRPLLSHDEKEMVSKITDRDQKGGHRTKTVILKGYPAVIFCSAGFKMDEQELTRFLVLSPESTQEKLSEGINQAIYKEVNPEEYRRFIQSDERRALLKERILDIKNAHVCDIRISNEQLIRDRFFTNKNGLKSRHQRDIKRFMSLIKTIALLNYWWRNPVNNEITANESDVEEAFKIWEKISISQEMNLSPYVYSIYQTIFIPLWKEKRIANKKLNLLASNDCGISRLEVAQKYYDVFQVFLDSHKLRLDILHSLETAGLITQEFDPNDRRNKLLYPTIDIEEYNVNEGGVVDHAQLQVHALKITGDTTEARP
ncbi:MAG: hypothetical protein KBC50_00055 [Candidatus Pacebacteria bacterium]|nr:hypothetical protein [Candidatus Paceibacterota bacterium]